MKRVDAVLTYAWLTIVAMFFMFWLAMICYGYGIPKLAPPLEALLFALIARYWFWEEHLWRKRHDEGCGSDSGHYR